MTTDKSTHALNIVSGLFPHMVLQRTRCNVSDADDRGLPVFTAHPVRSSSSASGDISIRRLTALDIPDCMRLKNAAGWNQVVGDWHACLDLAGEACVAAVQDRRVVGTGVAIPYGGQVAWVGMILVDAAVRRRGVATRIMQTLYQGVAPGVTVKLDASPAGQAVYEKLGFVAEYGLTRMFCSTVRAVSMDAHDSRPLDSSDLAWAVQLDADAFGAARETLLNRLLARGAVAAWRTSDAFCLGREGWTAFQVGPVVGPDPEAVRKVVAAALNGLGGRSVIIDVPDAQHELHDWLVSLGFVEQRPFVRMCHGNPVEERPEQYCATAGADLG